MSANLPPALVRALACALLAALALLGGGAARADTPIALYQAFRGQVNFVGTEETLRTKSNAYPCRLVSSTTGIYAYLGGLPSGAKILSAQLYWAGSGSTPDYSVTFDGVNKTAPAARRYSSTTIGGGYTYFSGAVDVTNQVAAKGNGYYTFSGLTVNNGDPWCSAQGVVGGFSLLVVYSHPSEAYRLLNVYEGFQYFRNSGFTLSLNNFAIPDPLPANVTGRVAHITWEGDGTLSGGGEDLLFNGYEMTDSLNPSGNQFNSSSNVTGDTTSYGIDFDAYTVKYPVIKPGQTTATTTYRSGQDMVLLSAEVAALPYIPVVDLSLAMTRSGTLTVGSPVTYTLTVTNGGPDTEIGPVTVVDTLPSGMQFVSASGTNWSCSSAAGSGQTTVVTCTQNGPVLAKTSMAPILLTASPTGPGSLTNTAKVSGATSDTNQANNTASNTATATGSAAANFVFTATACKAGDNIVASQPQAGECQQFFGPVTAALGKPVYITSVSNSGKAAALSTTTISKASVQLMLSCAPNSGVKATYAGVSLDCAGSWTTAQTVNLAFLSGQPSAVQDAANNPALASFIYADVGQLTLSLKYNNNTPSTATFVSRPQDVVLARVLRDSDGYPDQNGLLNPPDYGFARAGETFVLKLAARMADYSYAKSFGKEAAALNDPTLMPKVNLAVVAPAGVDALILTSDFASGSDGTTSVLAGKAQWYEAGKLVLSASLDDYLGSGPVSYVQGAQRTIGRFYPDHFTTDVTPIFNCLGPMGCPAAPLDATVLSTAVDGAAYSGQPFAVQVLPWALARPDRDADQQTALTQYQLPADAARAIGLSAASAPNGAALAGTGLKVKSALALNDARQIVATLCYELTVSCSAGTKHAGAWSAPLAVYVRASAPETRGVIDAASGNAAGQAVTISSAASSPTRWEDGLMVIDGRLFVANVFGSELARLPLPVAAQYWTAKGWQTNTNDSQSVVATSLAFPGCTRAFAGTPCASTLLSIVGVSAAPTGGGAGLLLANGGGRLILQAPARGKAGSIDINVLSDPAGNPAAATWLPSATGRGTFGLFKSPLIYLREVY